MVKQTVLQVIGEKHITNAQQLTAFFLNDSSKGVLSPYQERYGEMLWKERMRLLRALYADLLPKRIYRKKGRRPNKHI
jgi:hypothetical protein